MQWGAVGCSAAQCGAVGCSGAQWGAVGCSGVRCGAVRHSGAQWSAVGCSAAQWGAVGHSVAVGRSRAQWGAVRCSGVQWGAVGRSGVQCSAVGCSVAQWGAVGCSGAQWGAAQGVGRGARGASTHGVDVLHVGGAAVRAVTLEREVVLRVLWVDVVDRDASLDAAESEAGRSTCLLVHKHAHTPVLQPPTRSHHQPRGRQAVVIGTHGHHQSRGRQAVVIGNTRPSSATRQAVILPSGKE